MLDNISHHPLPVCSLVLANTLENIKLKKTGLTMILIHVNFFLAVDYRLGGNEYLI